MHTPIDLNIVQSYGLTESEYNKILELTGRNVNLLELSIFSVMWSEHCSYKSTRKHLSKLHTKEDWVICGPGENAGVIDIKDGDALIFKMESHNHPSFIEPYHGASTGVGGIIRDVFTMGAEPIALLNSLRFGEVSHWKTEFLLKNVVAGIADYGNSIGIPTVGGDTIFHHSFNGNILVNAMCVGYAKSNSIFYSAAKDIGGKVVYVGAKTGRDGIHGATMASAEFSEDSENKVPNIQVGDPFVEKLLIEACLEAMKEDAILAIQDMGAAGLTSSSVEMCSKGGSGMELWLDHVPQRDKDMTAEELMLSESQERMLMVIKPESEQKMQEIFQKWDLDFCVVGKITNSAKLIMQYKNEQVGEIDISSLVNEAPAYDREWVEPKTNQEIDYTNIEIKNLEEELSIMLASGDLCSKRFISESYDSMVKNNTMYNGSVFDAAVVRVRYDSDKAVVMKTDCTPRYVYSDPYKGTLQTVAENYRNISATGAKPLAITNCLNFGNPEKPEIMGQIVKSIEALHDASKALAYPVISGNVSLYNETNGNSIYPVPNIGGVGLIDDMSKTCNIALKENGNHIFVIGKFIGELGCSIYLREIHDLEGQGAGSMPSLDLDLEYKNAEFIRSIINLGLVKSCHDISDGGLLISALEMIFSSQKELGLDLDLTQLMDNEVTKAQVLFGEDQARYIIEAHPRNIEKLENVAKKGGVDFLQIGQVVEDKKCQIKYSNSDKNILDVETLDKVYKQVLFQKE